MIFPIGDDQVRGGHKPIVAYTFIAMNIIAFFVQNLDPGGQLYVNEYGAIPAQISQGENLSTLLTSMFMHGGFTHILGNMLFLWVFGDNIEAIIGNTKFLLFYLAGGIAAAYTHVILDVNSIIPCVGASGSISAVMGAYLVMFPRSNIKMLFVLNFRTFKLAAMIFLGLWIVQQIISGIGALNIFSSSEGMDGGGVAYWAHIGGFVFGALFGFLFKPIANRYAEEGMYFDNVPTWRRFHD